MIRGIFFQTKPGFKFFLSLFIIFFSFLFFYVFGIVFVQLFFKVDIIHNPHVLTNYSNPEIIPVLKFFQLIQSIGLFLLPPLIIGFLFYHSIKDFLRFHKTSIWFVLLCIAAILAFIPFTNLLSYLNGKLQLPSFMSDVEKWMKESENNAYTLTSLFLVAKSPLEFLYNVILIAIIPAISEELLFRGLFQRLFTEWTHRIHLSIWISAILFSAIHFQFYSFLPRLFLGLIFGYLLEYTGTIWIPIVAHFVNNFVGVAVTYFIPSIESVNLIPDNLSVTNIIYGIFGGFIGFTFVYLIIRKTNRIL